MREVSQAVMTGLGVAAYLLRKQGVPMAPLILGFVLGDLMEAYRGSARHWPASWSLSSARMRWGCCTTRNTIRLSWRLIFLDDAVASYVIAHELAHLEHFNHSKAFWKEVERLCPDWRVQLAKLNAAKVLPELEEVGQ